MSPGSSRSTQSALACSCRAQLRYDLGLIDVHGFTHSILLVQDGEPAGPAGGLATPRQVLVAGRIGPRLRRWAAASRACRPASRRRHLDRMLPRWMRSARSLRVWLDSEIVDG